MYTVTGDFILFWIISLLGWCAFAILALVQQKEIRQLKERINLLHRSLYRKKGGRR